MSLEQLLHDTLKPLAQRGLELSQQHRNKIAMAALALLGGFAVTAVAIAPLAPDAAALPKQVVTEQVEIADIAAQLAALSQQGLVLRRTDLTRSSDTVDSLLARLGVVDPAAARYLRTDPIGRMLVAGRPGKMVQAELREDGSLVRLTARYRSAALDELRTHFQRFELSRDSGQWEAQVQTVAYGSLPVMASGTVQTSLFAATDAAGVPDAVAVQLADIFSNDIDFHRELRKGDSFSVVYEALTADGEVVPWNDGSGRVLAAEFTNAGRTHHAIWFVPADGRGAYYGPNGESRRRAFLASPMEFSRVTSGFAMRMHPIFNTLRQHQGVDYAAPTGTPVRTVGDGIVEFAGWQNGFGNVVKVRHSGARETLYAHLSRIDVRKGQRVEQGMFIGAVGSTGWATGPHLHFEFRVNGSHQDPLRIARSAETIPLDAASKPRFHEAAERLRTKLDVAASLASVPAGAYLE